MPNPAYDVIVAGLGGIGSAILAECARRGLNVLGVDRHAEGHDLGASSGETRLFRKAYFESERYIPLLKRAEELWRRLEAETGRELLCTTGLLMAGAQSSAVLQRASAAAAKHQVALETLTAAEIRDRFPNVLVGARDVGTYEEGAGVVFPEAAISAHLSLADRHGASRLHHCALQSWTAADPITVTLSNGTKLSTRRLVLALGPWFAAEMRTLGIALRIERNVQAWFAPETSTFAVGKFPAFLIERPGLRASLYGFPDFGDGVKAAFHGGGINTDPDLLTRAIDQTRDVQPIQEAMKNWMPGAATNYLRGKACMYALTPDANFVLDYHPRQHDVILCGGFSGHGFKFAPVIGEIAADLVCDRQPPFDLAFLRANRF